MFFLSQKDFFSCNKNFLLRLQQEKILLPRKKCFATNTVYKKNVLSLYQENFFLASGNMSVSGWLLLNRYVKGYLKCICFKCGVPLSSRFSRRRKTEFQRWEVPAMRLRNITEG